MSRPFIIGSIAISVLLGSPCGTGWANETFRSDQQNEPKLADDTTGWPGESGIASYYGFTLNGRKSASGLRFDRRLLTAAHPWLPFGTKIRVTLGGSDRSVIVTITDRLYSNRRIVDLSVAAAQVLGIIRRGVAQVTLALI